MPVPKRVLAIFMMGLDKAPRAYVCEMHILLSKFLLPLFCRVTNQLLESSPCSFQQSNENLKECAIPKEFAMSRPLGEVRAMPSFGRYCVHAKKGASERT